ncbi:MAG TPA: hypothetical protein DHV62_04250, partial [Elusimicrobia bacterium]|nr:hypothetical protein [Elusimicrobiota bacterium]
TVTVAGTTTTISGALIEAIQASVTVSSTTTALDGTYSLNLNTGTYTVCASKTGYLTRTSTGVVVNPDQTTTLNFALEKITEVEIKPDQPATVTISSGT